MHVRYDEDLVEAVVVLCSTGHWRHVPSLQIARFHREREKLYAILDPDERNDAFFRLHLEWFREWGIEAALTGLVGEFPLLPPALSVLAFRKAGSRRDEGSELYVNEAQHRSAVIALRPERFHSDSELSPFLRHELAHLHDMVDPAFGYMPEMAGPAASLGQQRLALERYRLLWDITIDGRLTKAGRATVATRQQRAGELDRAFAFWPEAQRGLTFERLWTNPSPRHDELAAIACDPRDLYASSQPLPGAPCPLCRFPTFGWADLSAVAPDILDRIRSEFPSWTMEHGACRRCLETYLAAARYAAAIPVSAVA